MSLAWWAIDIDPIIAVVSLEFLVRSQNSSLPIQNSEEPLFLIGDPPGYPLTHRI